MDVLTRGDAPGYYMTPFQGYCIAPLRGFSISFLAVILENYDSRQTLRCSMCGVFDVN